MIYLTRLNGTQFVLNAELIESVEITPDTIISTTTGHKIIVRETAEEVIEKVMEYKRKILGIEGSGQKTEEVDNDSKFKIRNSKSKWI